MDSKTFAVGVLSITAVILLAALVMIHAFPAPVIASGGMTVSAGEYVVTVGKDAGDQEFIYIIDSVSDRLIVYRFDNSRKQIVLAQGIELAELRGPDKTPRGTKQGSKRGGYRGRP